MKGGCILLKKSLIAIALCLFLAPAAGWPADDSAPGPAVFLPQNVYEFDPVAEGTVVTHEFVIQNQGEKPLKIEKIKSG